MGELKYAVEMGSGAMIYSYIPSFVTIDSGIQKLIKGGFTDREHRDRKVG
jgi:hypothetical protein